MKKLAKYFFEGLVILIPIVTSSYIVYLIFTKIDGILHIPVPGLGFLLTLILITVIGFLASNFFTKSLFQLLEKLFVRLPLIKLLYSSIKDLVGAFVGDKKSFDKPVLVTVNPGGVKILGFVTRESLDMFGISDHVAVYFPQSYNFAGNLVIVPGDCVQPLSADSSEVMAFLVSGGVSGSSGNKPKN